IGGPAPRPWPPSSCFTGPSRPPRGKGPGHDQRPRSLPADHPGHTAVLVRPAAQRPRAPAGPSLAPPASFWLFLLPGPAAGLHRPVSRDPGGSHLAAPGGGVTDGPARRPDRDRLLAPLRAAL